MTMHTKTVFGMELLTASFMPGASVSVPYLLIDIMSVGKKLIAFVEYYDCRAEKMPPKSLEKVRDTFAGLEEYKEKPAWYLQERAPYSLIKHGKKADRDNLLRMVRASVEAYAKEAADASVDASNLSGLEAFRERMIHEGNPSSATLEKVFGKDGARDFFIKCVMPM